MIINGKKIKLKRYSSGEMKLLHSDFKEFIDVEIIDIFYEMEQANFFELLILLNYFKSFNKKLNLTLAYLPYQRMNHAGNNNVMTLQYVANLLNDLNLNSLTVAEPHCSLELFKNSKSFSAVKTIYNKLLKQMPELKNYQLVFTDKGGVERYKNLANNFIYGQKVRNQQTGLIENYELIGTLTSETVVIIDDIISTGDTIISAIEQLEKKNIKRIIIICGHLEKNKYNKRLTQHKLVTNLFATNSLTKKSFNKKIKLFSLWEILNEKQ
jgi:phosphoribosylpyrophosphate synthetase